MEIHKRARETTLSGQPLAPGVPRGQALATSSLVVGLLAVFLCPTISPVSIVLGPFAWMLGALDARAAQRNGCTQSLTGQMGSKIGRVTTGVIVTLLTIVALYIAVRVSL